MNGQCMYVILRAGIENYSLFFRFCPAHQRLLVYGCCKSQESFPLDGNYHSRSSEGFSTGGIGSKKAPALCERCIEILFTSITSYFLWER